MYYGVMARKIPSERLEQLVDCATQELIAQGYRRTQMAHIAAALGVAKGTLYLYVESKEALFDFVLRHADAPRPFAKIPSLPIRTPRPGATVRYVRDRLSRESRLPALESALTRPRVANASAELEAILRELYDVLGRNRCGIKLLDRLSPDLPELGALWFEGARAGAIADLGEYLKTRIRRKQLRPVPDIAAAARLLIETTVFWAVHRHWDAHPQAMDDSVAQDTAVHFLVGALT